MAFADQKSDEKPAWCRDLPRPAYRKLERVAVADKWFEVYRIRPGVFAVYEPHQQEEIISYLILGEKRALLFDTGMGISDMKKLVESLTPLPVSVMNSHTHNDHVGDNWRFNDVFGMDTTFTRENAKGSTTDAQAEITPGAVCGTLPAGFDPATYATRPFHITRWIHGGEKIDLGGRVLEVIPAPGHTPDSIALWDADNRLLFTGDTYYPGPIFLYRPETDLDAYVASIKRMNALGAKLLLPAHNVPVADPADLPRVITAMAQVRSGKVKPVKAGDKQEYRFKGFSFLMRANGN
jgi:glyoxylase-like metal-dependent hydrolase (beta-lactamase superfamily II)